MQEREWANMDAKRQVMGIENPLCDKSEGMHNIMPGGGRDNTGDHGYCFVQYTAADGKSSYELIG